MLLVNYISLIPPVYQKKLQTLNKSWLIVCISGKGENCKLHFLVNRSFNSVTVSIMPTFRTDAKHLHQGGFDGV